MGIYTMEQWTANGEFNAEPLQEISAEIYNKMLNAMPPYNLPALTAERAAEELRLFIRSGFLMAEPKGADKDGNLLYLAFGRTKEQYFYLGLSLEKCRETYKEMKERHQREVNALPIKYAFSTDQFNGMLAAWNIQPGEEAEKLYRLGNSGGYYLKSNAELVETTLKRIPTETKAAIAADKSGDGFIYEMFLDELCNHEYSYTGRADDTIAELDLTREEIDASEPLHNGLIKAINKIKAYGDIF